MKYLKLLICSLLLLCISCVWDDGEDTPPPKVQEFMNLYFKGYDFNYENIFAYNGYGSIYGLIEIDKTILEKKEIEPIYKKMVDNGWRVVEKKVILEGYVLMKI